MAAARGGGASAGGERYRSSAAATMLGPRELTSGSASSSVAPGPATRYGGWSRRRGQIAEGREGEWRGPGAAADRIARSVPDGAEASEYQMGEQGRVP